MRLVMKAMGPDTILSVPACCWAVMPGVFPYNNMRVPMLYTAFETTGASISGIRAALKRQGKEHIKVVGWAGDGGTFDIGIQAVSGAAERQEDVMYICYDNEAYMNTGIQRSSSTPVGSWTTTTQVGPAQDWEATPKKNFIEIMVAHGAPYVATANIAYPEDLVKKVQKAKDIKGFKYIQIYAPCPTGWRYSPELTIELGRKALDSCIYPLYEVENGVYKVNRKPKTKIPIKEYMEPQGRFRHLPEEMVHQLQEEVDRNWKILLSKEEFTKKLYEDLDSSIQEK